MQATAPVHQLVEDQRDQAERGRGPSEVRRLLLASLGPAIVDPAAPLAEVADEFSLAAIERAPWTLDPVLLGG